MSEISISLLLCREIKKALTKEGYRKYPATGCIVMSGNDVNELKKDLYAKEWRIEDIDVFRCHYGAFKIYYGRNIKDGEPEIYFKYD
jgi:hypothetical protein